jgi:hypothetical protein
MRQNNKSLRADTDIGGTFTNSIPAEVSQSVIQPHHSLAPSTDPLLGGMERIIADAIAASVDRNEVTHVTKQLAGERSIENIGRVTAKRYREMLEIGSSAAGADLPGFAPIRIAIRSGDGYFVVDTVEKAVEYLTSFWSSSKGEAFEEALQACIDGINHRVSPEDVRRAFIDAAHEAGIRVLD